MPVLGKSEDNYDSLKLITQALGNNVAGDTSGGLLQNHIYLWPANGDLPTDYPPTSAGMAAVLALTVAGDTIWLPSLIINLTAGITIPAGATMVGLSDRSTLSFASFSGTAITLGQSSTVKGFTVQHISNGTTAIGIVANAPNSFISDMIVAVSGGSSTNIAIQAGI